MTTTPPVATTPTQTPAQQAGVILHSLLSQFAIDLMSAGGGILTTSLASMQKTPTVQNVIAQGAAIALTGPLVLPQLEQQAIQQFATAGLQLLQLLPALAAKL